MAIMPAMELILGLMDFVLHVDRHIGLFVADHGAWVYALLFAIVFVETGLVVMPFLPGDSLLFITGALCGAGHMNLTLTLVLLMVAAITGDQVNYLIGRKVGNAVWQWKGRWFNRRAFEQAHLFYEKHGGITIVLARAAWDLLRRVRAVSTPAIAGGIVVDPRGLVMQYL